MGLARADFTISLFKVVRRVWDDVATRKECREKTSEMKVCAQKTYSNM